MTALLVIMVGSVAGLLYATWYGSEPARIRRRLRNAQTYAIVDLGDGQTGRIVGRAQLHRDHLVAPLSGRRCLYYVATIEQSKYGTDIWTLLATEQIGVPFAVTDGTGRAIVDATHAQVAFEFDHQSESRTVEELDDAQRTLLTRQRIDPLDRLLRYAEAIVTDGKRVTVLGAGTREPDPDAPPELAYRGAQPTRLRFTGSRRHPLVMSDAP